MKRLINSLYRFALLSGISFTLNFGLTVLLHEWLAVPQEAAFAVSLVTVFVVNFLACRYVVFDGRGGSAKKQLALFTITSVVFRGSEYVVFLLVHTLAGVEYRVAILSILAVSAVLKFFTYRTAIFKGEAASA